ncbi:MAG: glycosyltransferase family 4 protein [Candidatus Pacebacteria bacterium]|nr:glycosyltransferase family 4 protein [Candidatus Paceibacterota bacterium]
MDRIKILQIITLSEWGGAQRVVFDLADNLNKNEFQVEVACGGGGLLVEKLRARNIKVYEILNLKRELSFIDDVKAFFALKKLIKKEKYDIVHCHSAKAGILGRWAAKSAGVRNIYYTVHSWSFYNKEEFGITAKLFIGLEKLFSRHTKKIVCVANKVMADGILRKIAKSEKFLAIPNGIDFNVENKRDEIRTGYGIRITDIVFGMVARLAYPKDPLLFLQLAKEILKEADNAKFVLVGDGPLMQKCQEFIKQENLQEALLLLGEKTPLETRELFFAFDVFLLLSKFEGMPITVLEAMFAGLPIIASNVGGIGELIEKEKGGFLIRHSDKEALKEKMLYLIKNPQVRKQMGEYNFQKAREDFTLEKMVRAYEELYLE